MRMTGEFVPRQQTCQWV